MNIYIISILLIVFITVIALIFREKIKTKSIEGIYKPTEAQLLNFDKHFAKRISEYRIQLGLSPVIPELYCQKLAQKKSLEMSLEHRVSHDNVFERKQKIQKLGFTYFGECVGAGYNTIDSLFNAYLKSENHKKIIEHPKFRFVGCSFVTSDKVYNTLIFMG